MSSTNSDRQDATIGVEKQPLWRRILKGGVTLAVTGLFLVGSAFLVKTGTNVIAERSASETGPEPASLPMVIVMPAEIEPAFEISRRFVGQIEPDQQTDIAFESAGTLVEVAVDEGDVVSKGQVIARTDTRLLKAERDRLVASRKALEAQTELARRTKKRQKALQERGFASSQVADQVTFRLSEIEAQIAGVDASLAAVDIQLEKAVLVAPFRGRVATRHTDTGAIVAGGQAIVSLLQDASPRFRVGLDPRLARMLEEEQTASIEIRGRTYAARFDTLLPEIDATTRTRQALFEMLVEDEGQAQLSFGDTGTLIVRQSVNQKGTWLPLSALEDGVRGTWNVRTVEGSGDKGAVGLEAVQILHADSERAYVQGTFLAGTRIVLDGGHRVVRGQTVRVGLGEMQDNKVVADRGRP